MSFTINDLKIEEKRGKKEPKNNETQVRWKSLCIPKFQNPKTKTKTKNNKKKKNAPSQADKNDL